MKFSFILVEPENPENVGAAARALTTMGFNDLRLINPCDHLNVRARTLAHGSERLLEDAKVFPSLKDALQDISFSVGTTSINHSIYKKYFDVKELHGFLTGRFSDDEKIAIVFGRESSGLRNYELEMCDIVTGVPMACTYPTINLAQTVMIYAFMLSSFQGSVSLPSNEIVQKSITHEGYKQVKDRVSEILCKIDILPDNRTHKKIMDFVSVMRYQEIQLMHYLCEMAGKALSLSSCRSKK